MWLRIYLAVYALLVFTIAAILVPSCPSVSRAGFDVVLDVGCRVNLTVDSVHSVHLKEIVGTWLIVAGVVTAVGLIIALVRKRRPTWASALVWFSSGIAVGWYLFWPGYTETEYRSWILEHNAMHSIAGVLTVIMLLLAVPTGISLAVRRDVKAKSEPVAVG
jgi:hypothetical protein